MESTKIESSSKGRAIIKAAKIKVKMNLGFSTAFYKNKGKYIIKLELLMMNDNTSPTIIIKVLLSK